MMLRHLILLPVITAFAALAACADLPSAPTGAPAGAVTGAEDHANLDSLFKRLRSTKNPDEAQLITVAIRNAWAYSGQGSVDALVMKTMTALYQDDLDGALEITDQITAMRPDYIEGWNLRATIHYLREDYTLAVADIAHVLSLDPRHFGALTGLGHILRDMGYEEAALRVFEAALAINPFLQDATEQAADLREELSGIPI